MTIRAWSLVSYLARVAHSETKLRRNFAALILADPNRIGIADMIRHHVRRKDNKQFVVLFGQGIVAHGLIGGGNASQARDPGRGANIAGSNSARDPRGFGVAQAYAAMVFLI